VIALDTNLLVYAHREDSAFHSAALGAVNSLLQSRARFAVPWPCAHEFIAVVTHPRIYKVPTPLDIALDFVTALHDAENCEFIGEGPLHLQTLRTLATPAKVRGGAIHDARIAALCVQHAVRELWSADRDFSRYPALRLRNPLLG
jgi:toxin-antitoxin system PIN domain toxin